MMRIAAVILLFLLSLPSLSSAVHMDESIPLYALEVLESSVRDAESGKMADISFYDYEERETAGGLLASVTAAYNDKTERAEGFGMSQDEALSSLSASLSSLFFYDETLYADSEYRLEYIYGSSFSMKGSGIRLGTRLSLEDAEGRTRGVFLVSDHYTDFDVLKPLYLKGPLPGMGLRKESGIDWSLDYAMSFPAGSYLASFSLGYTAAIYPLKPFLQLMYEYSPSEGSAFYGGAGISARASLSSLIMSSFTLAENGAVGAYAALLAGSSGSGFALRGCYSVYYEHRPAPHFAWRIGYIHTPAGKELLTVGIGGDM